MSDYYIRSPNDYLEHSIADSVKAAISAALSGRTKSQHKYYKRISLGKDKKGKNKYEYFYSADEYAKWLKNQNEKAKDKISDISKDLSKFFGTSLDSIKDMAASSLDSLFGNAKEITQDRAEDKDDKTGDRASRKDIKFKEDKNGKDPQGHKYLLRVALPSGKYRYFYTQKEVDNYRKEQKLMKDVPKQDKNFSEEDQISAVNPNLDFSSYLDGSYSDMSSYTNCWSCSIAYELRERGYDVQALSKAANPNAYNDDWVGGAGTREMECYFQDQDGNIPSGDYVGDQWDFEDYMEKEPDGSRGFMTVNWASLGGHAMAWSKDNGKVTIKDCQVGNEYEQGSAQYQHLWDNIEDCDDVLRTDNLQLTKYMLTGFPDDGNDNTVDNRPAVMKYEDKTTDYKNDSYYYKYDDLGFAHLYDRKTGKELG